MTMYLMPLLLFLSLTVSSAQAEIVLSGVKARKYLAVFIHGLNGDETETWTNNETKKSLPVIFFEDPKQKEFDVLVFNYDGKCNDKTTKELASQFKVRLERLFKEKGYQGLSVIGHSYGGIIGRQLLLTMEIEKSSIKRIKSITTLGTPNYGSKLARFQEFFCPHGRIDDLDDTRGSYIEDLNNDWRREFAQIKNYKIPFSAAYETVKTGFFRTDWIAALIVEKESAVLYAQKTAAFTKDHRQIAKPKNYDDPLYQWIFDSIVDPDKMPVFAGLSKEQKERLVAVNLAIESLSDKKGQKQLYETLARSAYTEKTKGGTRAETMVLGYVHESNSEFEKAMQSYSAATKKFNYEDPAFKNVSSLLADLYKKRGYSKTDFTKAHEILAADPANAKKIEAGIREHPLKWEMEFSK